MNAYEQLKQKRELISKELEELDGKIAHYEGWAEDKKIHSWDKLYPSLDFIRHLIDNTNNVSPQVIKMWIEEGELMINSVREDTVTIKPSKGGLGLSIPYALAQSMHEEWLLLPDYMKNKE